MARILLIEDNDRNRYLTTYILEHSGHVVVQARDGREGIELAAAAPPDLILLDIQLPDLDGFGVAEVLRRNRELAATPIVAVTSHAMVGDRERILGAGCNGYIEKPIDPDTFADEVAAYLRRPPARGAGALG